MLTLWHFKEQLKHYKQPYKKGITRFFVFIFKPDRKYNIELKSIGENNFYKYSIDASRAKHVSSHIPYVIETQNIKPKPLKIKI